MEQLKSLLSGGVGGMCLVLAGQPFDLIKVRLQTAAPGSGVSAWGLTRATLRAEGVRGLYRGMAAPLAGVTPIFALCFWAYDLGRHTIVERRGYAGLGDLSLLEVGVAGAGSAIPTTLIMAPGERVKVILQTQGGGSGPPRFAGPLDVVRHLVRTQGVASVFRGAGATLARDGAGSFAYFAAYEWIKRQLTPAGSSALSPTAVVLGGGAAGVANWLVALPIDVVKSRLQAQVGAPTAAGGPPPPGALAVARALVAAEGVAGLYRGLGPALLRAFPANAACFAGIEWSKKALDSVM
jgi:solute carrier family 25 (mitochondrial carnitine/acylcarnitine transporter), member 20/29